MRIIYKKYLLALLMAGGAQAASSQLVINELMQSNIDCIKDDINEFPDSWVELYNSGAESVELSDYKIGDSEKLKKAYTLPSRSVAPGEFVIVYCDKVGSGLHTTFRLESGKGGGVWLFRNDEVVDKVEDMKKQPAPNISYGKKSETDDKWGYQYIPTPGAANCGTLCKEILGEPLFSVVGRVSNDAFELELSLPDDSPEGCEIRYTTDGKEPAADSKLYEAPIKVDRSTVVRAKLFCEGYLSPRSTTQSYIFHPRKLTLPVVSIVGDSKYFYDKQEGILVEGNYKPGTANYQFDWRRPINLEFFDGAGKGSAMNQLCETRVKGGATRTNELKSLAVYANKRFGTKRFNYEFFPDQTPGIEEFKSFEMRNSGNDFHYMYMRDAIIQQSMGMNVDLDWQPSLPVILYINGTYMGILNIRPRSNEDYVYSYYDGLEDIDMFENWGELKEGTWDNLKAFKEFFNAKGHTFDEYEKWMDTGEFCNLMIMGTFYDNKDFPGNNIVMWRPQAEDGRWRWISKDTDFGMGLYGERSDYPTLNWITTPGYDNNRNNWANGADDTRLFRRLLEVEEFRNMFIDRAAVYMGDFLTVAEISARIDKRYDELVAEYKFHRELINPWWPVFQDEIKWGKDWTKQRWTFFYKHLGNFFNLSAPVELTVDKGKNTGRKLIINDVPLVHDQFDGKYFPGRRLTIKSNPGNDGLYANGWEVKVTANGKITTEHYDGETLDIEMPQGSKVEISTILGTEPSGVDEIASEINQNADSDLYDMSGRKLGTVRGGELPELAPGVYILRQGEATQKIIVK